MSTPTNDEKKSFFKGKTPRNALIGVALVAAVLVGGLGIYFQAKQEAAVKADANSKKAKQEEFSRKQDGDNQGLDAIIAQQKAAAALKAKEQQRSQPTDSATPNADTFIQSGGKGGRANGAAAPTGDQDGIYSAGVFKEGGHQIKSSVNGVTGLGTGPEGGVLTPQQMMAAQGVAGRSAADTLAATLQGQAQQAGQDRGMGGGTVTGGAASQQSDLAFLQKTKLSSQSGAGFSTANFVGQETGCTLAPPNHIPVLTIEKLNSDRPGTASLLVTEDVYDSVTGNCLMIPKGSKIVAPYSSDIRVGAESIMLAGTELRLPNGKEVPLNGAAGADQDGEAGFSGDVNNHFFKIFGASFLTAVLLGAFDKNSTVSSTATPYGVTQVGDSAGQVAAQTSQTLLQRYQNIPPTITVEPGTRFMIKVNQNIHLEPYHG